MSRYVHLFILIFCLTLIPLGGIQAQSTSFPGELSLSINPEHPRPGESVHFTLRATSVDLNRTTIRWSVNGNTVENETNTTFTTTASEVGSVKTISARVSTQRDGSASITKTIRPQSVDILWEANTFTPGWYQGKALFTPKSTLTFTAIPYMILPGNVRANNTNLLYTWERNGNPLIDHRGVGKQTATIPLSDGRTTDIGVTVETIDGRYKAHHEITVEPEEPELIFYESHPLLGLLFNKTLGNEHHMQEQEITLTAIPFFFSTTFPNSFLMNYEWELNNNEIFTQQNQETFRNENGEGGTAHITVEARNEENYSQRAENDIAITF